MLQHPVHAPYLCPYRQGFRVLLTPLTYVPIGKASASCSLEIKGLMGCTSLRLAGRNFDVVISP